MEVFDVFACKYARIENADDKEACYYDSIYVRDGKSYLCYVWYVEMVLDLSLWKYSFELVTRELSLAKKKKQALDNLFSADKISQDTYNYLETELKGAIADLEGHLKSLRDRMMMRTQELEKQVNTLELFLASLEIHHAAGDVNDETYGKQGNAIILGLEATKQELDSIRNASQNAGPESVEVSVAPSESVETAEPAIVEVVEMAEPTEVEEDEEPPAEEPLVYEPVESVGPSQEAATETTFDEPAESEIPLLPSYAEEPSEQPSSLPEVTTEY